VTRKTLFKYQVEDGAHVAKRNSTLVAHEPRVGKSGISIHAADLIGAKLVVIVSPPNVKANWVEAIRDFRQGSWTAIVVGDNYAAKLLKKIKGKYRICLLVGDESHRFKNRDSQRTKAVFGDECTGWGGLVEMADKVVLMTGTPLPNSPEELWSMLRAVAPELILNERDRPMSYSQFSNKFVKTQRTPFGFKKVGGKNYKQLRALLMDSGFCIRRTRKEVFGRDLQPPTTLFVKAAKDYSKEMAFLEASPGGKAIIEALNRGGVKALGKLDEQSSKLRKIYGLAKVADLSSILSDELDDNPNMKIVLGFWHTDVGHAYMQALRRFHPLLFDGSVSPAEKVRRNQQFLDLKKHRVICGQIAAAGVGLNFSSARDVVFAEQSFVGVDNEQFAARIFNPMVTEPGFVRFAVLPGSTDAHVGLECSRKLAIGAKIFG